MSIPGIPRVAPRGPAPTYRAKQLRVACVQFDPIKGKVTENAAKVVSMMSGLQPGEVDLVVLPEMALSGYVFKTPAEIVPLLEKQETGPTARLVCGLAHRLRCHVIAGYPESLDSTDTPESSPEPETAGPGITARVAKLEVGEGARDGPGSGEAPGPSAGAGEASPLVPVAAAKDNLVGYNSAVIAGPDGVIANYRKTFLFETDEIWAREGSGFEYFDLPQPLGRVAVGICMDLNPKGFIAPWDAFELSTFCLQNKVDMLVMPMNWLDPGEQDDSSSDEDDSDAEHEKAQRHDPEAPSESNLNYWAARLTPLHDPTPVYNSQRTDDADPGQVKDVVFVAANRVGTEEGTKFVGTSAVMTLRTGRIELLEVCSRSEERVLVAEVP